MHCKFVKIIIDRNIDINWNNCIIDNYKCTLTENDIKNYNVLSTLMNNMPCIDDEWNFSMIINLDDNTIENWDFYDKSFEFSYNLENKASYILLDENYNIICEKNFKQIPEELSKWSEKNNNVLHICINKEGEIL